MSDYSVSVPLPHDDQGMIGRACPECEAYFKLKLGTGLPTEDCRCPYCGHKAHISDFATEEQLEYATSVAMQEISENLIGPMIDRMSRDMQRSSRNSFIKLSMSYKPSTVAISRYQERELESHVTCSACALEFAVYGVFANCPDCGELNALQVCQQSLDICQKRLDVLLTDDSGLNRAVLEDALGGAVSSFDALGKALRTEYPKLLPANPRNLFQNLTALSTALSSADLPTIDELLGQQQFAHVDRMFQVRHLFEHNAGVVDDAAISRISNLAGLRGRKYPITREEVTQLIPVLRELAAVLCNLLRETR